jgi:hypothetical protein
MKLFCITGHKYINLDGKIICERCGKRWYEEVKKNIKPAIIIKKETNLEGLLENGKNYSIK